MKSWMTPQERLSILIIFLSFLIVLGLLIPMGTAAELKKVTLILGIREVLPSGSVYSSIPKHLGYWKQEGLDVTVQPTGGSTEALQALVAGNAQFGQVSPPPHMALMTKEPNIKVKAFYGHIVHFHQFPMVLKDSPIQKMSDLKGKAIGVGSLASSAVGYMKALVAEAGLDPNKDVTFLPVGMGAQAAMALKMGKVEAISLVDGAYPMIEAAGVPIRQIEPSLLETKLGAAANFVSMESYLKENRRDAVGFARGVAKATLFAETNPEAAIKIHWKIYPESKPTGMDEKTALAQELKVLRARLQTLRVDNKRIPKWGIILPEEMEANQNAFLVAGIIKSKLNPSVYYTMELLDEINNFDSKTIIEEARKWKE